MILESLISNLCFRWACQAEKWKVKTLKSKFETSSNNEAAEFNKKVTDNISWKSSVSRTVPQFQQVGHQVNLAFFLFQILFCANN